MNHLAVAHNDGIVSIRQVEGIDNVVTDGAELIKLDNIKCQLKKSKEWIEAMRYSPSGAMLAVGSHDNAIYIYTCSEDGEYKFQSKFNKHSSYITALDWSLDETMIRSCCGAYELLFYNVESKCHEPGGASATVSTDWDNHTVKFGWRVEGIFPFGTDGTHCNSCEESKDHALIATGDDYGLLNVYRNPCRAEHRARSFRGHSEHVTNVKFHGDNGEWMLTNGGQDQTVIQWIQTIPDEDQQ
jgi:echinoderm microtubule-associated protein-like 1/2